MVTQEDFKQRIEGLSTQQKCRFAWQCGMRALPFLSLKRQFDYWPSHRKHDHLNKIFHALEVSALAAFSNYSNEDEGQNAASGVSDVVGYTNDYAYDSDVDDEDACAAKAAGHVASAALLAAAVVSMPKWAYSMASDAPIELIHASESANINFEQIIFDDIKAIRNNDLSTVNNDKDLYGRLWNNFEKDLRSLGYGYYTGFFNKVFDDHFTIDEVPLLCYQ